MVFSRRINGQECEISTLQKCLVEISVLNQVVVKASRADTESAWHFGALVDGKMINCGELYPYLPEVKQRKVILSILEALLEEVVTP